MRLTQADAQAVRFTEQCRKFFEQSTSTDVEFVDALFDNLYGCETDDGIAQCVAAMPEDLGPLIQARISELRERPHPGERYVFAGPNGETLQAARRILPFQAADELSIWRCEFHGNLLTSCRVLCSSTSVFT
jgi:hypothetical protein